MNTVILASRFDLPFYLRLPSSIFLTWDPESSAAAVLPRQRLGHVAFSRTTDLVPESTLLDAPSPSPYSAPAHEVLMTCQTNGYGEVPTLRIDTSPTGGFTELRPYTEITVFVAVSDADQTRDRKQKPRLMKILNHFVSIYRLSAPWPTTSVSFLPSLPAARIFRDGRVTKLKLQE